VVLQNRPGTSSRFHVGPGNAEELHGRIMHASLGQGGQRAKIGGSGSLSSSQPACGRSASLIPSLSPAIGQYMAPIIAVTIVSLERISGSTRCRAETGTFHFAQRDARRTPAARASEPAPNLEPRPQPGPNPHLSTKEYLTA